MIPGRQVIKIENTESMKITFITTVFNEEKGIEAFVDSILSQSKIPDEIIIVDGGSTDKTMEKINNTIVDKKRKSKIKIIIKRGNRAVGRNEAIRNATGDIIVCSDAGNILDKDWAKHIIEPFTHSGTDVVAGYYRGLAKNVFQKCVIPYALVMPDNVRSKSFLPATRSIAFKRSIWLRVGKFDERLSHNEDYAFARKLKSKGANIVFAKKAVVYWVPRDSYKQAFIMMFRFAYGDIEAGIVRQKVIFLFTRYFVGVLLFILAIMIKSVTLFISLVLLFLVYLVWAIWKNFKYVREWQAIFILPILQLIADAAVLTGSITGVLKNIWINSNSVIYGIFK